MPIIAYNGKFYGGGSSDTTKYFSNSILSYETAPSISEDNKTITFYRNTKLLLNNGLNSDGSLNNEIYTLEQDINYSYNATINHEGYIFYEASINNFRYLSINSIKFGLDKDKMKYRQSEYNMYIAIDTNLVYINGRNVKISIVGHCDNIIDDVFNNFQMFSANLVTQAQLHNEFFFKGLPTGSLLTWCAKNIPGGWLVADGSILRIEYYKELYDLIGNTYGGSITKTYYAYNQQNKVYYINELTINNCIFEAPNKLPNEKVIKYESLAIDNLGGYYRFSEDSYGQLDYEFDPTADSWEIRFRSYIVSPSSTQYIICGNDNYQLELKIKSKLALSISSNGTSWDIANEEIGTHYLRTNEYFDISISFTGTQYIVKYKYDDSADYITDITINNSNKIINTFTKINFGNNAYSRPDYYFKGMMKDFNIYKNNELVYKNADYIYINSIDGNNFIGSDGLTYIKNSSKDIIEGTFALPNLISRYIKYVGNNSSLLGSMESENLPNLKGTAGETLFSSSAVTPYNGVFTPSRKVDDKSRDWLHDTGISWRAYRLAFDAYSYNNKYTSTNEIRPLTIDLCMIIKY